MLIERSEFELLFNTVQNMVRRHHHNVAEEVITTLAGSLDANVIVLFSSPSERFEEIGRHWIQSVKKAKGDVREKRKLFQAALKQLAEMLQIVEALDREHAESELVEQKGQAE